MCNDREAWIKLGGWPGFSEVYDDVDQVVFDAIEALPEEGTTTPLYVADKAAQLLRSRYGIEGYSERIDAIAACLTIIMADQVAGMEMHQEDVCAPNWMLDGFHPQIKTVVTLVGKEKQS